MADIVVPVTERDNRVGVGPWEGPLPDGDQWDPALLRDGDRRNVVDRAISLGGNEIIAKPFSPKTLWSRLDEVINRPRPFSQVKSLLRPIPRANSAAKALA